MIAGNDERGPFSQTALVTGAAGFLGTAVAQGLLELGWNVVGIGRSSDPIPGSPRWLYLTGGIEDAELPRLLSANQFDLIFHAAGTGSVGRAEESPGTERQRALGSIEHLISALAEAKVAPTVVFPSSAAIYGDTGNIPAREDQQPAPMSEYDRHKVSAEQALRDAAMQHRFPVGIIRYGSIYGPGLRKQLLWDVCMRLLSGVKVLAMRGTGEEMRDFLHVDDAVAIAFAVARATRAGTPLIVNGGTGSSMRVREMATCLVSAFRHPVPITFDGVRPPFDPANLCLDVRRASAIGFAPRWTGASGVDDYAAWVQSISTAGATAHRTG